MHREPHGVGGWLALFLVLQCALPLLDVVRGFMLVETGTVGDLFLRQSDQTWLIGGLIVLVLFEAALAGFVVYRLTQRYTPESVTITIWILWVFFALIPSGYLIPWTISGGLGFFYTLDLIVFQAKEQPLVFVFGLGWAIGWTAYFMRSLRIEHTYYGGEEELEVEEVFN